MAKRESSDAELSIEAYRAKRDFSETPEPSAPPGERGAAAPVFVVQRHEARRLHYDLRLEMDGVLKSFAVPKGFSWDPADKHLAVRTEDHPLAYFDFEGVIPKGEYGAGTMTIWDRGTYAVPEGKDALAGLDEGKLEVRLDGGRLRGEWHLVKTSRGDNDWLLFKHRDRYARPEGVPACPLDLSRQARSPLPKRPRAMVAASGAEAFDDPDWLFELAFAGQRVVTVVAPEGVRYHGPTGKKLQLALPGLEADVQRMRAATAAVDGVLVATDENGRPDAALLQAKLAAGEGEDVALYAFDLLYYEAWDVRAEPLEQRKRALASLIPGGLAHLLYVDHVVGRGTELMQVVAAGGLPGVVAKRRDSRYRPGTSDAWRLVGGGGDGGEGVGHVLDGLASAPKELRTRVKLSNLDKVYWPEEGVTKGQLLDYYSRVAGTLLPYLRDRPIHLLRYPDGITGKAFYQKTLDDVLPSWVQTAVVDHKDDEDVRYVVCNDRDTLMFLVNLGSIDLHPWMSRVGSLDAPDYLVLDLDPSTDDFAPVVRIAKTLGKLLRGAGMRPLLKTSGARGLHVHIPLQPGYTYEQARMFGELVAHLVVKEHRDIATVERSKSKRGAKVYVDYLQNAREQTVVPAYVVRPKPGATVSAPLHWDELEGDLQRREFNIFTVPERLERLGDLHRGLLDDPHDLIAAVERLGG